MTSLATDNATLALYDSQYRVVAQGVALSDAGQTIDHFVSQSGGTYYVCITGGGAPYSLVVTKDAAFNQQSTSIADPLDISGEKGVLGSVKTPKGGAFYQVDDGTMETGIGLGAEGDLLWLNCFDAVAGQQLITSIDVAWGNMTNGKPASVLVYEDPNNDGNPTDAVLLEKVDTTVAYAGTDTFTTVPITPVTVTGKFFIAALVCDQSATESPAP